LARERIQIIQLLDKQWVLWKKTDDEAPFQGIASGGNKKTPGYLAF